MVNGIAVLVGISYVCTPPFLVYQLDGFSFLLLPNPVKNLQPDGPASRPTGNNACQQYVPFHDSVNDDSQEERCRQNLHDGRRGCMCPSEHRAVLALVDPEAAVSFSRAKAGRALTWRP